MKRGLLTLSPELFPQCTQFLLEREYRCVTLVSTISAGRKPVYPEKNAGNIVLLVRYETAEKAIIDGVVQVTAGGTLLHMMDPEAFHEAYHTALRPWLRGRKIYRILGTVAGTRFLETILSRPCIHGIDYELMTRDTTVPAESIPLPSLARRGLVTGGNPYIRRAHQEDASMLLPLQMGYEKEEVLIPGRKENRKQTLMTFTDALGKQDIYAAFYDNRPVGKAGTNAQGIHWDQLGGIYTKPEFRGHGIASYLVSHVVQARNNAGKKTALFVRLTNEYAKKAYINNGFTEKEEFRIVYY